MHHRTTIVDIDGRPTHIDAAIADDVARMNARGIGTLFSCEGDPGIAYVAVGARAARTMPGDIIAHDCAPVRAFLDIARAAGFDVDVEHDRAAVYGQPHDHAESVGYVADDADVASWAAAFRAMLRDAAHGTLDPTGTRYAIRWPIHDTIVTPTRGYADATLREFVDAWTARGGQIHRLCAGDQAPPSGRAIAAAHARWQAPPNGIPDALKDALATIGYEVADWGIWYADRDRGDEPASATIARNNAVLAILRRASGD